MARAFGRKLLGYLKYCQKKISFLKKRRIKKAFLIEIDKERHAVLNRVPDMPSNSIRVLKIRENKILILNLDEYFFRIKVKKH